MIKECFCGLFIRGLIRVFGIECFAIAFACSGGERVLLTLEEFLKEVPA
jgi:hypothetical protein